MKNIALILLTILCLPLSAQKDNLDNLVLNNKGLTYDSVMHTLDRKDVSFEDKYRYLDSVNSLTPEKQIIIENKLLEYVDKDNAKRIELCCRLFEHYSLLDKTDSAKVYLNIAIEYKDLTNNAQSLGNLFFQLGSYHLAKEEEGKAHENFYKSISYYETLPNREITIVQILFKIAYSYVHKFDAVSLQNIATKMLLLAEKSNTPESYLYAYPVAGIHYRIRYNNLSLEDSTQIDLVYLDSVYYYDRKTVEAFENADASTKERYATKATMYYMNVVDGGSIRSNPNWKEIQEYVDKGLDWLNHTDTTMLLKIHHVKARALFNQKKYDETINESLKALSILKSYPKEHILADYDFYSLLSETYELKRDYPNAFKYEQHRSETIKKINETERYQIIKELETQYDTAQKDLLISQQNEREQQLHYNIALMVGGFIIVAILLILAVFYNRLLRLRKEKEIVDLDKRVKDKDIEYLTLLNETEERQTRNYLDGLESERTRLAKELHDNVANKLYILDQELKKIEQLPNDIPSRMEDLYSNIRNISHELIPPVFKNATLSEVLHNYIFVMGESGHTTFDVTIENEENLALLSQELCLEIYRIVQEATGNILKHAKAKNVSISLSIYDNSVKLVIEDDGKGFDIHKHQQGIGLQIIRNRCESLQGELQISSEIGLGTKIGASFFLNQAQSNVAE